jgi:hypothetical protein
VLRAYFPGSTETHTLIQDFFFREDLMLRRHDYNVNIAGGFAVAQLTSKLCEGEPYSAANQTSRLYARPRSPTDHGNADGFNRHQRRELYLRTQL